MGKVGNDEGLVLLLSLEVGVFDALGDELEDTDEAELCELVIDAAAELVPYEALAERLSPALPLKDALLVLELEAPALPEGTSVADVENDAKYEARLLLVGADEMDEMLLSEVESDATKLSVNKGVDEERGDDDTEALLASVTVDENETIEGDEEVLALPLEEDDALTAEEAVANDAVALEDAEKRAESLTSGDAEIEEDKDADGESLADGAAEPLTVADRVSVSVDEGELPLVADAAAVALADDDEVAINDGDDELAALALAKRESEFVAVIAALLEVRTDIEGEIESDIAGDVDCVADGDALA